MARWRIIKDGQGMGGFLSPPGDAGLLYAVEEYAPNQYGDNVQGSYSLASAVDSEWVPASIRRQARARLAAADRMISEDWLANVYGYFRNCYSPDGIDRNVSTALIVREGAEKPSPERSLAVLLVREYFPDHTPRLDLLDTSGGYGQKPCTNCGTMCQYEARVDGWAPYGGRATCDEDGTRPHAVAR